MLFENKKHKMNTVNKHKIALKRDDDTRKTHADRIMILARGYSCKLLLLQINRMTASR